MKRLIFLFIFFSLFVSQLIAQNTQAFYYFPEDKVYTPPLYQFLIDYFSAHIDDYDDLNGETTIELPKNLKIKKDRRTTIVEGFYVQFEWTVLPSGKDVTIHPMDCDIVEIDFKKKEIKEKKSKDDKAAIKPDKLKEKIKIKDKKKANTGVSPSGKKEK